MKWLCRDDWCVDDDVYLAELMCWACERLCGWWACKSLCEWCGHKRWSERGARKRLWWRLTCRRQHELSGWCVCIGWSMVAWRKYGLPEDMVALVALVLAGSMINIRTIPHIRIRWKPQVFGWECEPGHLVDNACLGIFSNSPVNFDWYLFSMLRDLWKWNHTCGP